MTYPFNFLLKEPSDRVYYNQASNNICYVTGDRTLEHTPSDVLSQFKDSTGDQKYRNWLGLWKYIEHLTELGVVADHPNVDIAAYLVQKNTDPGDWGIINTPDGPVSTEIYWRAWDYFYTEVKIWL